MILISTTGYFDDNNNFRLKEVQVSNQSELYILKSSEKFVPYKYQGNVKDLLDARKNSVYPLYSSRGIRVYEDDDDARSMANFFMDKLSSLDMKNSVDEQSVFDVLSSFGKGFDDGE